MQSEHSIILKISLTERACGAIIGDARDFHFIIIRFRRPRSLNLWTTVVVVTIQQRHFLNAIITILHLVLKTFPMARKPRIKLNKRYMNERLGLVQTSNFSCAQPNANKLKQRA